MKTEKSSSKKRWLKIIIRIVVALVILIAGLGGYIYFFMYPYRENVATPEPSLELNQTLNKEQATKDLQYLLKHLEDYHPAYLDGSDELTDSVAKQYQLEIEALGEEVSVLQLWQAAERIASRLKDGHTNITYNNPNEDSYISDFTQIQEYGGPVAINGIDAEEIFETFKTQYSYETEDYAKNSFYGSKILSKQYLEYCDVDTSDGVTFTYKTGDETLDYHYDFVPISEVIGYEEEDSSKWVSYEIDKANNLGIFTLTSCKYNEEYRSVLDEFFNEVHKNGITNIAVDLRGNGGGNSLVANAFLKYIDVDTYHDLKSAIRLGWYLLKQNNVICKNHKKDVTYDGNIYVLTNIFTYSAAMDFTMLIGDNDLGKIVGRASGNMPNSYGDCLSFQLPNSKLCMSVSFKKWYRIDTTKADDPLTPDYEVAPSEALDKVYELIKE